MGRIAIDIERDSILYAINLDEDDDLILDSNGDTILEAMATLIFTIAKTFIGDLRVFRMLITTQQSQA